jgi:hypothetical protein
MGHGSNAVGKMQDHAWCKDSEAGGWWPRGAQEIGGRRGRVVLPGDPGDRSEIPFAQRSRIGEFTSVCVTASSICFGRIKRLQRETRELQGWRTGAAVTVVENGRPSACGRQARHATPVHKPLACVPFPYGAGRNRSEANITEEDFDSEARSV